MKKLLSIITAAFVVGSIATFTTGCQTDQLPTYEQTFKSAHAFGTVAGVVVKWTVKDTNSVQIACTIMEEVRSDIPKTNETFTACWMPKIKTHLDDLKSKGKIDDAKYIRIYKTSEVGCKGLDMFVDRYPAVRQYEDLTYAAVDGFVMGFEGSLKFKKSSADQNVNEDDVKALATACSMPYIPVEQRK